MAQIEFYIEEKERSELFEFISENKGVFIPDMIYYTPIEIEIINKEELIQYIYEKTIHFFILSPFFQLEPVEFFKFKDGKKHIISQRKAGPAIDIAFYRGFAEDAPIKHMSTVLHHYAQYIHYKTKTGEEFKATNELKEYYNMIIKFLKVKCKRVTASDGKKYWVSKEILEKTPEVVA